MCTLVWSVISLLKGHYSLDGFSRERVWDCWNFLAHSRVHIGQFSGCWVLVTSMTQVSSSLHTSRTSEHIYFYHKSLNCTLKPFSFRRAWSLNQSGSTDTEGMKEAAHAADFWKAAGLLMSKATAVIALHQHEYLHWVWNIFNLEK